MNPSPRLCMACRAAVPDAALESGAAILLLGKAYCPACKGSAMKDVSLEDLSTPDPPPARRPPPAAAPTAPKPTAPAAPPPPRERHASRAIRRPPASKLPLVLIGAAVVLAVVLALVLRGGGKKNPPNDPDASTPRTHPAPADPQDAARAAYEKVEVLHRRGDVDTDRILAAIEAARPACAGTPFAAKLNEDRLRIVAEREKAEASKKLDPLLDTLKKGVAADKDFSRYDELQALFQEARVLAARASPSAVASLQTLQQDYANRYERAAEPFYKDILEAAEPLSREGRHDDALRHIDSFPKHLRKSGAWRGLEALRTQIEKDKRLSPPKKK